MSLSGDVKTLIESGMKLLDSLMTDITYREYEGSSYDTATGTVTETVTDYDVRGLLTGFTREERRLQEIELTDRKLIITQTELPITPTPSKDAVIVGAEEYEVYQVYADPTDTVWSMWLKRTK